MRNFCTVSYWSQFLSNFWTLRNYFPLPKGIYVKCFLCIVHLSSALSINYMLTRLGLCHVFYLEPHQTQLDNFLISFHVSFIGETWAQARFIMFQRINQMFPISHKFNNWTSIFVYEQSFAKTKGFIIPAMIK